MNPASNSTNPGQHIKIIDLTGCDSPINGAPSQQTPSSCEGFAILTPINNLIKKEDLMDTVQQELIKVPVQLIPCGHFFDESTLKMWPRTAKKICPLCRKAIQGAGIDKELQKVFEAWKKQNKYAEEAIAPLSTKPPLPEDIRKSIEEARRKHLNGYVETALDDLLYLQNENPGWEDQIGEEIKIILQPPSERPQSRRRIHEDSPSSNTEERPRTRPRSEAAPSSQARETDEKAQIAQLQEMIERQRREFQFRQDAVRMQIRLEEDNSKQQRERIQASVLKQQEQVLNMQRELDLQKNQTHPANNPSQQT